MNANTFSNALGKINDKFIMEALTYQKRHNKTWLKWGAMAACLCLIIGTAVTAILRWSLLPSNDVVHEPEPYTSVAWEDVPSTEPFGALFPSQIIEGYELEGEVALYGEGTDGVMEARFYNEQLSDELVITVYAKGHYGNETLNEIIRGDGHDFKGSMITINGGDYVVHYATGRDIAEISGFEDMVRSAQAFSSQNLVPNEMSVMIELDEVKSLVDEGYTTEDFNEKLLGKDVNTILQFWGEPDYQLSGVRGLGWYLDGENNSRITLYFNAEKYVEDISIDTNIDSK